MFFDWLTIEQDFGVQLPLLGDVAYQRIHIESGEASGLSSPVFQHQGSFCDSVSISVRGSTLKMSGNPSRWGRLDNLFGLSSVDKCVSVYNVILLSLGLLGARRYILGRASNINPFGGFLAVTKR